MNLVCFECNSGGAFNTLIIFDNEGEFDPEKPVSQYHNLYTNCADFGNFKKVKKSRFAIVREGEFHDSWLFTVTTDRVRLREMKYKLIGETELAKRLPKIFKELLKTVRKESSMIPGSL
jgi:hypothetical protein